MFKSLSQQTVSVAVFKSEIMKLVNPINYAVPLRVLSRTDTYKIRYNCSDLELSELQETLTLKKILSLSFKGEIIQPKKKRYELHAVLKATIIQDCVITSKPVKTLIEVDIERFYSEELPENNIENLSSDRDKEDIEPIQKELHIGAIAAEELVLRIPDYPRKKNVKFEGVTITDTGLKPLDNILSNPFSVLKDFSTK